MNPRPSLLLATVALGVVLLVAAGAYFALANRQPPAPNEILTRPIPTSPPPLRGVEFPTQGTPYPADWPAEIRYPQEFRLVEATSGAFPVGGATGWFAKLRLRGTPQDAADQLSSFLTARGWQVYREDLDAGAVYLEIERDSRKSTGSLIIDPDTDNPGYTKILSTVRL